MDKFDTYKTPSEDPVVAEFLKELETIPWFADIGEPLPVSSGCKQIHSWDEWLGPEEPSVAEIGYWQQALHDEITGDSEATTLSELSSCINDIVFRVATRNVPYDSEQDAWHAPTSAVWHAACTADLIGLCLFLRRAIPSELEQQWRWFVAGHWPCDWDGEFPEGRPIVY